MHEKIVAKLELPYVSRDTAELDSKILKSGKNLSDHQVEAAIIQFLANTNFSDKYNCYDFNYNIDSDEIKDWLRYCREQYENLSVKDPACDEYLEAGEFKIDHKYCSYAHFKIFYHRRYLENE